MNCIGKTKSSRDAYGEALVELGKKYYKDIVVLDADVSSSTRTKWFADKYPDRFFNFGVAESNMIGVSAGLARCNKIVFATSFAVFSTSRVLNQIRTVIASCNLPVKIVGTHAGICVGEDGASHQAIEDIAIMRAMPNMAVVVPADATETKKIIFACINIKKPIYIRLSRLEVDILFDDSYNFRLGRVHVLTRGKDMAIIACGILLHEALKAAEELAKNNISIELVNCSSIKPIDRDYIIDVAKRIKKIVVAEEHNIIGGLGSAVLEVLAKEDMLKDISVRLVGINDKFGASGNWRELFKEYNIAAEDIKKAALDLLSKS